MTLTESYIKIFKFDPHKDVLFVLNQLDSVFSWDLRSSMDAEQGGHALSIEQSPQKSIQNDNNYGFTSAHTVDHGTLHAYMIDTYIHISRCFLEIDLRLVLWWNWMRNFCRFVATSGVDDDNELQLWMDIEFLKSDNGATGLDVGCFVPFGCGILHCLCQLALSSISVRQWPEIHQIQRCDGLCFRWVNF